MRRHRVLRSSRSSHNTIFTAHAIWHFTRFSEGLKLPLACFKWREKKPMQHDKDIDHPIVVLPYSELRHPHFLNHLNWENFPFHDKRQCTESVDLFLTHTSSSFNQSISIQEHCMGASTSLQWTANSFLWYLWTGSSSKPCWILVWVMYGSHSYALRRWREPRWLSASLLVSSSKLLSCFSSIFFEHDLPLIFDNRPFSPRGSASPLQVAQSFQ